MFLQNILQTKKYAQENMMPNILAASSTKFLFVCHYFVFSNFHSRNALVPLLHAQ